MKKRSMLAVASLAVGFAASLAAPAAHAVDLHGDGKTPNLGGNSSPLTQVGQLLGGQSPLGGGTTTGGGSAPSIPGLG